MVSTGASTCGAMPSSDTDAKTLLAIVTIKQVGVAVASASGEAGADC